MRFADRIIDLGPGAGTQGGEIVAQGSWKKLASHGESPTGKILGKPLKHPLLGQRRSAKDAPGWLSRRRRVCEQSQETRCGFSRRAFHRTLRRQRRGQKHATSRRDKTGGAGFHWKKGQARENSVGPVEEDRRLRYFHLSLRGRPGAHRQDVAFHACDLHWLDG